MQVANQETGGRRSDPPLALYDADVHPSLRTGLPDLSPYLTRPWRRRLELNQSDIFLHHPIRFGMSVARNRVESTGPAGGPPGSDPRHVQRTHLDAHNIERALLNSLEIGALAQCLAPAEDANVLCTAFNDFFVNEWLSIDERFAYALCVSPQDPTAAAAEIGRIGPQRGVVAAFLPLINTLLGNRHFYPIYDAAQELDLPIYIHLTGCEFAYQGAAMNAGGFMESYAEKRVAYAQLAMANLSSLVFNGVFDRFPRLKVAFVEAGFSWVLPHLWRMDSTWRYLRMQNPWVTRRPSEYVRDRVRFTTQPIDEPDDARQLDVLVEMLGVDCLLFATDYPHWDEDEATRVFPSLSADARQRVLADNARAFFR